MATTLPPANEGKPGLGRRLGAAALWLLVLNGMVGAGIFVVLALAAIGFFGWSGWREYRDDNPPETSETFKQPDIPYAPTPMIVPWPASNRGMECTVPIPPGLVSEMVVPA